jgi:hypothetical protein
MNAKMNPLTIRPPVGTDQALARRCSSQDPGEPKDPPLAYPPETVLTIHQVAEWLQVSPRTIERLGIPCATLGHRTRRYLARHVLEYLEGRTQ